MDGQPLLLRGNYVKKTPGLFVSCAKWSLKFAIWLVFVAWVALIFLNPSQFFNPVFDNWIETNRDATFGKTAKLFLVFSGPVLVIAFLSVAYLIISGEDDDQELHEKKKASKHPSFRLWTFPVLVDGPFGVVSATEFIGILLFLLFVIWALYSYTMQVLSEIPQYDYTLIQKSHYILEALARRFGYVGLYCLAFLFLPIARGSVLLRMIDIPFEHAIRYHVWLGHLTILLFTLHGLLYVIAFAIEGDVLKALSLWQDSTVANLPGVISLSAGLLMWLTSLYPVRKQKFELFFFTHQLYVVFVIFFALHVGDFTFSIAAGGIFLFMLDRFLRICQSRRTVGIISAQCHPCGTVELILSKPANLRYNALSFIFLRVGELSWLQWHPFSVSSSPLDGKYHLSILIKGIGEWTTKLQENLLNTSSGTKITASVEGPYGHDLPYHLIYENLILVAGGIGISPFLAILSDIFHRVREGKPCLPQNILLVWAVKTSDELHLLSIVDMESICPFFSDKLNLKIKIYVTQESESPLEEGKIQKTRNSSASPMLDGCSNCMSVLVGTGNNIFSGLYVISSTLWFVILISLLYIFYITPFGINTWWYKGLLFVICMLASVFIFGGLVVGIWHLWGQNATREECEDDEVDRTRMQHNENAAQQNLASSTNTYYGSRPDFKEIFGCVSDNWGRVDVGVIVCGPPPLQSSVASEIRSLNVRRQRHHPIFHFNSHSFDL
ncbi:hypothetical protein FH972_004735 [Carpinus fangiana]|uniref:ferric-chelate reductase (NADH) n=1 Tax=Carpinus fangiana TaxID=176857 RepID=A0A5N6QNY8_9ROSI|nr:hypothetical protein FH972_004735 [Carpinus fangiana]